MNPIYAIDKDDEGMYISYPRLRDILAERGIYVGPYVIEKNKLRKLKYTKDLFVEWLKESWIIDDYCMIWFPVTKKACNIFIVEKAPKGIQYICYVIIENYSRFANEDGVVRLHITNPQL